MDILMGSEWKTPPKYQLNHPYSVWHPLDTLKYTHTPPYQHRHTQCISKGTHKHPWHSTYIICQPHFAQSPSDHPWPNKSLSDCLGSGEGCSWGTKEMLIGCLMIFWGVQGCLGEVRWIKGALICTLDFSPINIHGSLIRVVTFFNWPGGPRSLKYQNVRT